MRRREFGGTILTGALAAGRATPVDAAPQASRGPRRNTLMHVGGDYHSVAGTGITSKAEPGLQPALRSQATSPRRSRNAPPTAAGISDELKKMRDDCDQYGVTSRSHPHGCRLHRACRKGPERDRELDNIIGNIEKASQVGVRIITYHWTVIPIRRNQADHRARQRHLRRFPAGGELEGPAGRQVGQG